ncbi:hypothetical protein HDU89_005015 [Geranomyces variabilis]|nr:hypothetical protein HDU89_005015 [Geranomyces variabilis]
MQIIGITFGTMFASDLHFESYSYGYSFVLAVVGLVMTAGVVPLLLVQRPRSFESPSSKETAEP